MKWVLVICVVFMCSSCTTTAEYDYRTLTENLARIDSRPDVLNSDSFRHKFSISCNDYLEAWDIMSDSAVSYEGTVKDIVYKTYTEVVSKDYPGKFMTMLDYSVSYDGVIYSDETIIVEGVIDNDQKITFVDISIGS